jgi:DNA recombination protein RmuC
LERAGEKLGAAVDAYNSAIASLERQVLPQARRFTELGTVSGEALTTLEPVERLVRSARLHADDRPAAAPPDRP